MELMDSNRGPPVHIASIPDGIQDMNRVGMTSSEMRATTTMRCLALFVGSLSHLSVEPSKIEWVY